MPNPNYLIVTVGLPRSGKSTWARKYSEEFGYPVVNPDSIRLALHKNNFILEAELFVRAITQCHVSSLFISGYQVVILDATNYSRDRRNEWQSSNWVTLFKYFDTPVEECKRRALDSDRSDLVSVIEKMDISFDTLGFDEKLLDETYMGVNSLSKFDLCKKVDELKMEIESLRTQLEINK